jgi:hypothetical protein
LFHAALESHRNPRVKKKVKLLMYRLIVQPPLASTAAAVLSRHWRATQAAIAIAMLHTIRKAASAGRTLLPRRRELRANRAEGRCQLRTKGVYNGDDSDRNSRGNQPIFDDRGARLIVDKLLELIHVCLHCTAVFWQRWP